jgi:hypothetical protein
LLGRRLLIAGGAILIVAVMVLAYAAFLAGGKRPVASTNTQTAGGSGIACEPAWGPSNLNATILPSNSNILFSMDTKRLSDGWLVRVIVINNGTETVDLPWLAKEGLQLVVYNSIGSRSGATILKTSRVPVLQPRGMVVLEARIHPTSGAPLPVYVAVFNPKQGVALAGWLEDPARLALACGAYKVEAGSAVVLFRWIHTIYGLTVVEGATTARDDTVLRISGAVYNATLLDPAGGIVGLFRGIAYNGTILLHAGQVLVLGGLGSYTAGMPATVNLTVNLEVGSSHIKGYEGRFDNIASSPRFRESWRYASATLRNNSLAIVVDYAYNGYILVVKNVKLVASENTSVTLNASYPVRLFGMPVVGVRLDLEGGLGGSASYAVSELGSSSGVRLVSSDPKHHTYTYSIVMGSYTLSKLLDLSGISTPREHYTVFYAPIDSNPKMRVTTPWGVEVVNFSSG